MSEMGAPGLRVFFYWESELKDSLAVKTCELKYNYHTQKLYAIFFQIKSTINQEP